MSDVAAYRVFVYSLFPVQRGMWTAVLISSKISEFRTPTPQDVPKKGSEILKLPPVRNCFTLTMTNKLVVIINSLKYQKLRKFYYMK